jgi:hypothetical protein
MASMTPETDQRSPERRATDERIAAEPPLAPLNVQPNTPYLPVEAHLARRRRPIAVAGVVENGVVRPLDPTVKLSERSRVIIVASDEG